MHIFYLRQRHKILLVRGHIIIANFERHLRQHVIHENHLGKIIPPRPGSNDIAPPPDGHRELIVFGFHKKYFRHAAFEVSARCSKIEQEFHGDVFRFAREIVEIQLYPHVTGAHGVEHGIIFSGRQIGIYTGRLVQFNGIDFEIGIGGVAHHTHILHVKGFARDHFIIHQGFPAIHP